MESGADGILCGVRFEVLTETRLLFTIQRGAWRRSCEVKRAREDIVGLHWWRCQLGEKGVSRLKGKDTTVWLLGGRGKGNGELASCGCRFSLGKW